MKKKERRGLRKQKRQKEKQGFLGNYAYSNDDEVNTGRILRGANILISGMLDGFCGNYNFKILQNAAFIVFLSATMGIFSPFFFLFSDISERLF